MKTLPRNSIYSRLYALIQALESKDPELQKKLAAVDYTTITGNNHFVSANYYANWISSKKLKKARHETLQYHANGSLQQVKLDNYMSRKNYLPQLSEDLFTSLFIETDKYNPERIFSLDTLIGYEKMNALERVDSLLLAGGQATKIEAKSHVAAPFKKTIERSKLNFIEYHLHFTLTAARQDFYKHASEYTTLKSFSMSILSHPRYHKKIFSELFSLLFSSIYDDELEIDLGAEAFFGCHSRSKIAKTLTHAAKLETLNFLHSLDETAYLFKYINAVYLNELWLKYNDDCTGAAYLTIKVQQPFSTANYPMQRLPSKWIRDFHREHSFGHLDEKYNLSFFHTYSYTPTLFVIQASPRICCFLHGFAQKHPDGATAFYKMLHEKRFEKNQTLHMVPFQ